MTTVQLVFGHFTLFVFLVEKSHVVFLHYPEKDLKTKCVVEMDGNQTVLHPAVTSMNTADPR